MFGFLFGFDVGAGRGSSKRVPSSKDLRGVQRRGCTIYGFFKFYKKGFAIGPLKGFPGGFIG